MSGRPTADRMTDVVQKLTLQWVSEILDEPDVTPEDNFIDLGGHSILAVRLTRKAMDLLGADYDLMILFEEDLATAAAELASRVSAAGNEEGAR
ncbi:phosphopantetheine-binding protein [Streptomyces lusitanus]|uniref:Phosphopantetheine-binding protein n=1 Tax=Streptomyces lusitanus TaxID=68232 RepID=A0ABU3JV20_9ACTN|nr:phosphopantetheine-binding protein [Streptomyces lusitanus]